MNALDLLKKDHAAVKALFRTYEKAGDRAEVTKKSLFDEIKAELDVHAEIEEQIFYPAVKAARSEEAKDTVREGLEEHAIVKTLLGELSAMTPADEQFDAKMKVLIESVEHHAEEEEEEMFKQARKVLSEERLERLGADMLASKEVLVAG